KKYYVPRTLSAALLMALLVTPFTFLGLELAEPAERWMHSLPEIAGQITEEIEEISETLKAGAENTPPEPKQESSSFFSWFNDEEKPEPNLEDDSSVTEQIKQNSIEMGIAMLGSAPLLIAQVFACLILIFFLLVFGPGLFGVFIRDFPVVTDRQRTVVLVGQIQSELSAYIVTISMINFLLGVSTAVIFTYLGIDDAMLWGALVALMNFVPYLGGLVSCSILLVAGAVQYGLTSTAFLPPVAFFCLNVLESQLITPSVLGKSMRLNPLLIILWIAIMGWLWGVVGALLAVPILMSVKIILENLGVFPHWIKLLESK
ncbi:MAG: AI-2E family transporter, partial [Pseudomonadota bacterium]|nr:AI-2E family transporter [Pseudomonadota bacterium]